MTSGLMSVAAEEFLFENLLIGSNIQSFFKLNTLGSLESGTHINRGVYAVFFLPKFRLALT